MRQLIYIAALLVGAAVGLANTPKKTNHHGPYGINSKPDIYIKKISNKMLFEDGEMFIIYYSDGTQCRIFKFFNGKVGVACQ